VQQTNSATRLTFSEKGVHVVAGYLVARPADMLTIPYHGLASVAMLVGALSTPRPHAERTRAINRLANGILVEQLILLAPLRVVAFLFFALPKSFFTFIHIYIGEKTPACHLPAPR
jgi:hypothetical protein